MHLEILYKSVSFISETKILENIHDYKAKKERLRIEEEQRQHDSKSKKKLRAKSIKDEPTTFIRQNISLKSENNERVIKDEVVQKPNNLTPIKKMITRSSKREETASAENTAIFKSHRSDKRMNNYENEEDDIEVDVSAEDSSSS